jgi:hypothetical protein
MNGVAAQARRFQAVAIINGVPCNKMIVSPVRSNVCLSRLDLQRGPLDDPDRKCRIAAGVGLGRRQQCEDLRTLDTRNTLRAHDKSNNANPNLRSEQAGRSRPLLRAFG